MHTLTSLTPSFLLYAIGRTLSLALTIRLKLLTSSIFTGGLMLLLTSFNHNVGDTNNNINILINSYFSIFTSTFGVVYDGRKK